MRIGVLTWYSGNYGSFLQAYAMQEALALRGHEAVFIRHDLSGDRRRKLSERLENTGSRSTLDYYTKAAIGHLVALTFHKDSKRRLAVLDDYAEDHLRITKRCYTASDYPDSLTEADAFMSGSDQVWNPNLTCFSPFYWMEFVPDSIPKFSYAPSVGNLVSSESKAAYAVEQLNRFDAISVREKASADQLQALPGLAVEVHTVLDPTLLHGRAFWKGFADGARLSDSIESDYAFVYLLRSSSKQRQFAADAAAKRNLKIVTYPYLEQVSQGRGVRSWGDFQVYDENPADFVQRIRNATLVITDSFHCCALSSIFHKDFYVLPKRMDTASQLTRIDSLLATLGLEDRKLTDLKYRHVESDFAEMDCRLERQAKLSRDYLDAALNKSERKILNSQ